MRSLANMVVLTTFQPTNAINGFRHNQAFLPIGSYTTVSTLFDELPWILQVLVNVAIIFSTRQAHQIQGIKKSSQRSCLGTREGVTRCLRSIKWVLGLMIPPPPILSARHLPHQADGWMYCMDCILKRESFITKQRREILILKYHIYTPS